MIYYVNNNYSTDGNHLKASMDDAFHIAVNAVAHDIKGYLMCHIVLCDVPSECTIQKKVVEGSERKVIALHNDAKRYIGVKDSLCIFLCVQKIKDDANLVFDDYYDPELDSLFVFVPYGTNMNAKYAKDVLSDKIKAYVPQHNPSDGWMSQEEISAEIDKFLSHIKSSRATKDRKIEDSVEEVEAKIIEHINAKANVIRDRLRASLNAFNKDSVKPKPVDDAIVVEVLSFVDSFDSSLRTIANQFGQDGYQWEALENLAWVLAQLSNNKTHPSERKLNKFGITSKWGEDDESGNKINKSQLRASRLAFDTMWSISPIGRPRKLIDPDQSMIHSRLIEAFGEHARLASVIFGIVCFASTWGSELRRKAAVDSKASGVMRLIISEAIKLIPQDDPLRVHLMDTRKPDTSTMPINDLLQSVRNWCKASVTAYLMYHDTVNEVIVDLHGRAADGEKEKWSNAIIKGLPDCAFDRRVAEQDFGFILADHASFKKLKLFGGDAIDGLHVVMKPTKIVYDGRMYSMGRYEIFISYNGDKDCLEVDFLLPSFIQFNFARKPHYTTPDPGAQYIHSHIQQKSRGNRNNDTSSVICFGNMSSRYQKNSFASKNSIKDVNFDVSDCFDGAPTRLPIYGMNAHDLINTMFHLTLSCYKHNENHEPMNINNWSGRRVQ